MGGHCHLLWLSVGSGHRQLLSCVGGGGLKKRSHVTSCDNGIMFVPQHEITCISHVRSCSREIMFV